MYPSSPFRSTLGLDMCKVCTEAVHLDMCVKYIYPAESLKCTKNYEFLSAAKCSSNNNNKNNKNNNKEQQQGTNNNQQQQEEHQHQYQHQHQRRKFNCISADLLAQRRRGKKDSTKRLRFQRNTFERPLKEASKGGEW